MYKSLALSLALVGATGSAHAAETPRLTLQDAEKLSPAAQDAYLSGLIDALALSSGPRQTQLHEVAGCMRGFAAADLRKRAFSTAPAPGLRHFKESESAAEVAIERLAFDCQLQWQMP